MNYYSLALLAAVAVLLGSVEGRSRAFKRPTESWPTRNKQHHSIKMVHYAIKRADGRTEVETVPVRNLKLEAFDSWVAKALWTGDDYNSTGWSRLEVETNENASDFDQAFGAGLLEGQLTKGLISLHLLNTVGDFCKPKTATCQKLISFLEANFEWIQSQVTAHQDDPYWHHVNLTLTQFDGLYHGYYALPNANQHRNVLERMLDDIEPYLNLIALQLNGDMGELLASLSGVSDPFIAGSCSALIKLLPGNEDLYVSHDTWTVFESMLRILKHYKFNYHLNNLDPAVIPGSEVSFSSYPGILSSIDDFYVLKSRLVVLETTIGNSNVSLWKYVTPDTNLYWVRNMVANRLAVTGADWAKWFSLYNSGTYNNEWMVVDFKQFYPGQPLKDGLLTVLEQIPGQTVWSDKTDTLRAQTYWPSYNIPYYPEVYNLSGTYDAFVQYGSFFSYEQSPRANIFRRDHSKIVDINSMIRMMRYNNYTHDEFSECACSPPFSGENTIAARSDLNPASGTYPFDALGHRDHGATDMKLTNWQMSQTLDFVAICGPTHNDVIPPFVWSQADFGNSTNHFGHPDKWTFEPLRTQWKL